MLCYCSTVLILEDIISESWVMAFHIPSRLCSFYIIMKNRGVFSSLLLKHYMDQVVLRSVILCSFVFFLKRK